MTDKNSEVPTVEALVGEIKSRFEQAKAAKSAMREVGGYGAGHALGYYDALGELLEFAGDAAIAAQSTFNAPVAYLHTCPKFGHKPELSFEVARNPDWTSTPLYTGPSLPSADYECQDCIGMKDHGCYCKAHGCVAPGGPLPSAHRCTCEFTTDDLGSPKIKICPTCSADREGK